MTNPTDPKQVSASQSNPPPALAQEAVGRSIQWLADEHAATEVKEQQALISYESGVLREAVRDEAGAARDLLAAYNADPEFREPVETLASLLQRRKSYKNLGRLLDALVKTASGPEQSARAQLLRGQYLAEHQSDAEGARAAWEQAVSDDADHAGAWLELELLAGKTQDAELRLRALEQRARLAEPEEWKALLRIDLAKVMMAGDTDGAIAHLLETVESQSPARFRAAQALGLIARKEGRDALMAQSLELQAKMLVDAIADTEQGDASGVPVCLRSAERAADAYLRASEARRRAGDSDEAAALLDKAIELLPDDRVLLYLKLKAAESSGDIDGSSAIARRLLEVGGDGTSAAPLWMRVFEAAAARGERDAAIEALTRALAADPGCIPARALQLDLLVDGDAQTFASSLEGMAADGMSDAARGRAYLLASHAWAVKARDVAGAKAALTQAAMFGVAPAVISRVARTLAALVGDDAWLEESTRRLVTSGAAPAEHVSLWWELARARMLRGDRDGASKAFESLAALEGGAWLGRVLAAYALGLLRPEGETEVQPPKRSHAEFEQLASVEVDPVVARALTVVAALLRARSGDLQGALERLRDVAQSDASDLFVAVLVADLERASGNATAAASVLSMCASGIEDGDVSTALRLEAGFLFWRSGERARAIEEFAAARANHPDLAGCALLWANAALEPESLEGRRRTLEVAEELSVDPVGIAIERFAAESCEGGDLELARAAIDVLETDAQGEFGVVGWLARVVYAGAIEDRDGRSRALDGLESLGIKASAVVAAERHRIARVEEQDPAAARDHARKWTMADGGIAPALEWMASSRMADDADSEQEARRMAARSLSPIAADALLASSAVIDLLRAPSTEHPPLLQATAAPAALVNLELAPAGCDPRRRAAALRGLGSALGDAVALDALALSGWSLLAGSDFQAALAVFRRVTEQRPEDLAAWEGLRASAEAVDDVPTLCAACERLGAMCADAPRGARFLEKAGLLWIERGGDAERGERALSDAFARDSHRDVAFDRLFRRVRAREDNDLLLTLIARRLEVAEQTPEIAKLFWEQARVLRQKGDFDGAMGALENVTMLEPDHVGALALSGEIFIRKGDFAGAVDSLSKLAEHSGAPNQQRLVSGMAAVDLCENKLNDPRRALDILLALNRAGLSTAQLRERLAKAAAANQAWPEAVSVLETLMTERKQSAGRIEAARLAMAICRDKIQDPSAAERSVAKLLDEVPQDAEALDLVIRHEDVGNPTWRAQTFARARKALVGGFVTQGVEAQQVELLARIARALKDNPLRQSTLGALVSLGRGNEDIARELQTLDAKAARTPQVAVDDRAIAAISDPRDVGPIPQLISLCSGVIVEALGPTIAGLGVTRKDRIDARDGHPMRNEIAHWAGALGISQFELYIGGRDPNGIVAVPAEDPGDPPMLVVGANIPTPLTPSARQAVARELFALRRGTSIIRTRDDATVACVVVALCREGDVQLESPPFAMMAETQRLISKAMSRKIRKLIPELCQSVARSGMAPRDWVSFALSSLDRMAAIAAGDVSLVLSDVLGPPRDRLGAVATESERARRLIAFVLGDDYLELRQQLGMGVQ